MPYVTNYTYPAFGGYPGSPPAYQQLRQDGQLQQPMAAPMSAQNISPGFVCRPVTSREEAVAVQAEFLGPGTIMPDFGHSAIYFKRVNPNTGASDFFVFALQQQEEPAKVQYATIDDLNALREEIEQLRPRKAVKKNDAADE